MDFPQELLLPQKTVFREGSASDIGKESAEYDSRGLIVHGCSLERSGNKERILEAFAARDLVGCFCRSTGEPDLDEITSVIGEARSIKAGWIAGVGGGSVLDLAKAAAGLYNAARKPVFYQEGGVLEQRGIPFIAVPTTCGTGSEATPNSVITNKERKSKLSIRDRSFMARKVILDPLLLDGIPPDVLSFSAMDAFVQAYESYISRNATWYSESLALKAIGLLNADMLPAFRDRDRKSLSSLLLASYLAGLALASSRLGVIHGLAHPLGALYDMPHGLICSALFIPSIEVNKKAMGEKYGVMSGLVGGDLSGRVRTLLGDMGIGEPFKGMTLIEKEKIIQETLGSGSTAANPKKIEREDVEYMLKELF